jgi:hypothetical protein
VFSPRLLSLGYVLSPYREDDIPLGWLAYSRSAGRRGSIKRIRAFSVKGMFISSNKRTIILFRETGVPELNLDRELQLAAINYPV